MANQIIDLDTLKEKAIHIYSGIISVFPYEERVVSLELSGMIGKYNGCYSIQGSSVGFIHKREMYVIPYTERVIRSLKSAGLKRAYFYVPFSNGDYPKEQAEKWAYLKERVVQSYIDDLMEDCITYSDNKSIGELSEEVLRNCIELPFMGLAVTGINYETCYYPIINIGKGEEEIANYVGKYNFEGETVMFVYRDGRTYLARGNVIIKELQQAGYTKKNMLVPLSHGEKIMDEELQERWECIKKLAR